MTAGTGGGDTHHVVALWRLQSAYADIVTRRAWPELTEVFRPDATIQIDTVTASPRSIVGPEALGQFVGPAIEGFDHFTFVILNTVVEVVQVPEDSPDGTGTARGRLFICEVRHDRAAEEWRNAHGVYQDDYAWEDGRWWISGRRYRSMARSGLGGTVLGLPPDLPPFAR